MPDFSPHRLTDFLTRPLRKPAHQERAREVLAEVVVDRELGTVPRRFGLRVAVLWLLAALAVGLVWNQHRKPDFGISFIDVGDLFSFPMFEPEPIGGESPEELWFFGFGEGSELEQKRKLHQLDPDRPLYYRHYVDAYVAEHGALPPEYFETVERIDPDNAYWYFQAAVREADEACEHLDWVGEQGEWQEVDGRSLPPPPRTKIFEIKDPFALERAIALLEKGCELAENRTLLRQHIARVDEISARLNPDPALGETISQVLQQFSHLSGTLLLKKVDLLLGAALYEVAQTRDEEGFRRLERLSEAFLRQQTGQLDEMLVGALVHRAIASEVVLSLAYASRELGLEQEAARYQAQADQFHALRSDRRLRRREPGWMLDPRMGVLHQQAFPVLAGQVASPPAPDGIDFRPLRMAEHELASRWLTIALGLLLLLLALPLFLMRFVFPRAIRVSAPRAGQLLNRGDWFRVFGLGVLTPIALHLVLTLFTPLGGRGHGIGGLGYAYPVLPLLTLGIVMAVSSSILIQRALEARLPLPPVSRRQEWPTRIYLGLTLAIYLIGFLWLRSGSGPYEMYARPERTFTLLWIHAGLLVLFLLWSLWVRVRGSHDERFRQLATLSGLLPCIPVAVLCLAALLPIHLAGEKRWLARDESLMCDPSKPDYGLYEVAVAREHYRETEAILFPEDK